VWRAPGTTQGCVADGAIVHSVAGSHDTSRSSSEKLLNFGLAHSGGRVGTAYDDALIESSIALYKTELAHRRATGWDRREELELATAGWVPWFNCERLHERLGTITSIEIEAAVVHQQSLLR